MRSRLTGLALAVALVILLTLMATLVALGVGGLLYETIHLVSTT